MRPIFSSLLLFYPCIYIHLSVCTYTYTQPCTSTYQSWVFTSPNNAHLHIYPLTALQHTVLWESTVANQVSRPVPVKEKRYKKKVVYLEPPTPGSVTLRRKITTVVPAPSPPPPPPVIVEPPPPPPVLALPPPPPPPPPVFERPPPPVFLPPPPPPPPARDEIDVIAVDVEPSEKSKSSRRSSSSSSSSSSKSSKKTSRSQSRSRYDERERELIIERDRYVPVPVRRDYETYRYVEGPPQRRYLPAPPSPPRRLEEDRERITINIEDRRRAREYHYR